jgi:hypothetical protein
VYKRPAEINLSFAPADFAARLLIDARNEAETVILATEKSLRSPLFAELAPAELGPGEHERILSALAELKAELNGADRETLQQKTHSLTKRHSTWPS